MSSGTASNVGPRRLFLLDGSALAYRSYHAFVRAMLTNDQGLDTGGIFGYTKTLLKIIDDEAPDHIAVIFDHPKPTFRHKMYSDYKATREKMPDDMREQVPYMKRITEALGIPLFELEGYEADDVIGTLARAAEKEGFFVNIVSGDKDFMQIVSPNVVLYNIMKSGSDLVVVDENGVREKFGVSPDQVVEVLALMGDKSDNVPGVTGVGEKTAMSLVAEYGSVKGVYEHLEEITGKKRENLENDRDAAFLSRELVTIDCDAPVNRSTQDLEKADVDRDTVISIFKELQFNSLAQDFSRERSESQENDSKKTESSKERPPSGDYRIVETREDLEELCTLLLAAEFFVVDLETTSLNTLEAVIVGFAFSLADSEAWYVPLNAHPPLLPVSDDDEECSSAIIDALRPALEDPAIAKGGQNIKYDMSVMLNHDITLRGVAFDSMIASYLLEPGSREHDLDSLALKHFDHTKIKTTDLIGKGKDQITMDLLPVEVVGEYAAEDADYTYRLCRLFEPLLEEKNLRDVFTRIEMPLVPILSKVERNGVRLDRSRLKSLETELSDRIEAVEKEIFQLAGREFNIASPKQLGQLLFEEMELHKELGVRPRKTKTGFSTNHEVLEKMGAHPLPLKILEYRSLAKLMSTYVLTLPKDVDPVTGRIHTSYNQAVAATGRLSSRSPNLQNIPVRTDLGRRIREAFVPGGDDWRLLSFDYSQIELRVMAHVSGDPDLIGSFQRGADIHADTASKIFEVPIGDVTGSMRSKAKNINFGILYGMGPVRLASETGMTQEEAAEFIERYFSMFPSIRNYIEKSKEDAREQGVVTTLLGRQRPITDIDSKNGRLRSAAENMAVNTPIQGTAADIIKLAMIEVDRWMTEQETRGMMILQVHDELVFDVPGEEVALFRENVPHLMENVLELDVPLVVDIGEGENWSAAH